MKADALVYSENELLEVFSKSPVIAITLNHEDMTHNEVKQTILEYEYKYELPTTDVLKFGSEKLVEALFDLFPKLQEQSLAVCQPLE